MVEAVRGGSTLRAVARRFRVTLRTVQRWVRRAGDAGLDEVDWAARAPVPRTVHRTPAAVEDRVLGLRRELRETSDLGEYGAPAIHREWGARGWEAPPAVRTIGRILERRGALDGQRRVRRPPPPVGWFLPAGAAGPPEVDCFDVIEGLVIKGGIHVEVLTGLALRGGLPAAWPGPVVTAKRVVDALTGHWRAEGLPPFALFDNDSRFQGNHQAPDTFGRVTRLCLQLRLVPVFAPPQEPGFQGALENFNGRWQAKVWARFQHASLASLAAQSARYIAAYRRRVAARLEGAPPRRPFPAGWQVDFGTPPCGLVIFLRRADPQGRVTLLGHLFAVDPQWPHRLVRAEVTLPGGPIRFFGLRRREPLVHSLLREVPYELPKRRWRLQD